MVKDEGWCFDVRDFGHLLADCVPADTHCVHEDVRWCGGSADPVESSSCVYESPSINVLASEYHCVCPCYASADEP